MKKLIIVCGRPAAGKSTYAKNLAKDLAATLLDIDTCTEKLIQVALKESGKNPDDRDSQYFKGKYREPIYATLFAIAKDNLTNNNVIIVGPFTKEILDPTWPNSLTQSIGVKPEFHYVQCDLDLLKKRMQLRSNPRDRAKLEDWEKSQAYYGEEQAPLFEHILVSSLDLISS